MLEGDLATTGVAATLARLGAEGATGCLRVTDPEGEDGLVHLRDGRVYSVTVPGLRPQLGPRLVSSGALGPDALEEALEAQRTELQGWRLSELLVHLGYVDPAVLESFVVEQVREAAGELLQWTAGRWRFRTGERTRDDVAPPTEVADLLREMQAREDAWAGIRDVVPGPAAVPRLAAGSATATEVVLDSEAWSLLCKVDGERTVARLARECGFTLFEAGRVTCTLVQAGLLEVPAPEPEPEPVPQVDAVADPAPVSLEPLHLLEPEAHTDIEDVLAAGAAQPRELWSAPSEDALAQVSIALSSLLGDGEHLDAPGADAPAAELIRDGELRPAAAPDDEDAQRRERIRQDAAAELAATHAAVTAVHAEVSAPEEPAPEEPAAEEWRDPEGLADAGALLRELSLETTAAAAPAQTVDETPDAVEETPAPRPPAPRAGEDTDTAALLRELSSLGFENEAPPAPRGPSPRPVAAAGDRKTKRKGLFGRG